MARRIVNNKVNLPKLDTPNSPLKKTITMTA